MIAINCRNVVLLFLLSPVFNCFSQTDTTLAKEPDFVNEKFKERTSMFYIAGNATVETMNYSFAATNGIYTAFEHKFKMYHAIGAGAGYYIQYRDMNHYIDDGLDQLLRFNLSYKFFYNLNIRMSKGLTGNNFSANYLYISPNFTLIRNPYEYAGAAWDFTNGYWVITSKRETVCIPRLKVGFGFQRVIRNKINFDLNAGLQFGNETNQYEPEKLLFGEVKVGFIIK
jgi:hypothetical protein